MVDKHLTGGVAPVVGCSDHSLLRLTPTELTHHPPHPLLILLYPLWPPARAVGRPCRWVDAHHGDHGHGQVDPAEVDVHQSKAAHPSEHIAPGGRHYVRQFSLYLHNAKTRSLLCVLQGIQFQPIMWHHTHCNSTRSCFWCEYKPAVDMGAFNWSWNQQECFISNFKWLRQGRRY